MKKPAMSSQQCAVELQKMAERCIRAAAALNGEDIVNHHEQSRANVIEIVDGTARARRARRSASHLFKPKRRRMSADARRRISDAQKARWAKINKVEHRRVASASPRKRRAA